MDITNNWIYIPNGFNGISLFEGEACLTKEAQDIISIKDITDIKNKINQLIANKKELNGASDVEKYGLNAVLHFFNEKSRYIVNVNQLETRPHITNNPDEFINPELLNDASNFAVSILTKVKDPNLSNDEVLTQYNFAY